MFFNQIISKGYINAIGGFNFSYRGTALRKSHLKRNSWYFLIYENPEIPEDEEVHYEGIPIPLFFENEWLTCDLNLLKKGLLKNHKDYYLKEWIANNDKDNDVREGLLHHYNIQSSLSNVGVAEVEFSEYEALIESMVCNDDQIQYNGECIAEGYKDLPYGCMFCTLRNLFEFNIKDFYEAVLKNELAGYDKHEFFKAGFEGYEPGDASSILTVNEMENK